MCDKALTQTEESITYLKRDVIKVEPVAHIIVGTDRLGIVVYHDGTITHLQAKNICN